MAYYRTSSKTNETNGSNGKDSLVRQQAAVQAYCKKAGLEIAGEQYETITGDSLIEDRAAFQQLMAECKEKGVSTIIVENAGRFARSKDTAIRGMYALQDAGITSLVFADKELDFIQVWHTDALTAIIPFLEIAFAEKEKRELVEKMRNARERKKLLFGKCEGRKSLRETMPDAVKLAKKLRRKNPATGKVLSYRKIAARLAESGFHDTNGNIFSAQSVRGMCGK